MSASIERRRIKRTRQNVFALILSLWACSKYSLVLSSYSPRCQAGGGGRVRGVKEVIVRLNEFW